MARMASASHSADRSHQTFALKLVRFSAFCALLTLVAAVALAGTPDELQGYGLPGGDIYVGPALPAEGIPVVEQPIVYDNPYVDYSYKPLPAPTKPIRLPSYPVAEPIAPKPTVDFSVDELFPGQVERQQETQQQLQFQDQGTTTSSMAFTSGTPAIGTTTGQFSVSTTGAATYGIPISVPPGTAGMQPKLTLNYSSQSGNGQIGMGWSLGGLSSITRCPATFAQDGKSDGVNFNGNDKLCLDGQRLMVVSGTYGASNAEYRTEIDTFAKVTTNGAINSVSTTFTVRTKAGLIFTYGGGDNASFKRPLTTGGTGEVYIWAVGRIQDTVGNYITVKYAQDSTTREYRVDQIDYTGNAGLAPYNSVRFLYDDTRADVFERYLAAGSAMITAKARLTSIETWADGGYPTGIMAREYRLVYEAPIDHYRSRLSSLTECAYQAGTPYCLPPTVFNWQSNQIGIYSDAGPHLPFPLRKNSGGMYSEVVDLNADGLPDQVVHTKEHGSSAFAATSLNKNASPTSTAFVDAPNLELPALLSYEGRRLGDFADINGDGFPDFVRADASLRATYINNNGNSWYTNVNALPNFGYRPPVQIFDDDTHGELQDLNGDGLVDFIQTGPAGVFPYINQPTCQTQTASCHWGSTPDPRYRLDIPAWQEGYHKLAEITDITGDGLPDFVYSDWEGAKHTYINDPSCLELPTPGGCKSVAGQVTVWRNAPDLRVPGALFLEDGQIAELTDLNGDGLKDFLGGSVRINTGTNWVPDSRYNLKQPVFSGTTRVSLFADINGDGLNDQVYTHGDGKNYVYFNANWPQCSDSSAQCRWQVNYGYTATDNGIFNGPGGIGGTLVDINGDGLQDIAIAKNFTRRTDLSKPSLPDLLAAITTGLGHLTIVYYGALSQNGADHYKRTTTAIYPKAIIAPPLAITLGYQYSHAAGAIDGFNAVTYKYENLKAQLDGRGLLGFTQITETDTGDGLKKVTQYLLDFPYTGMVFANVVTGPTNKVHRATSALALGLVQTSSTTSFPYIRVNFTQAYETTPNQLVKTTGTETDYNSNGCASSVKVSTAGPGQAFVSTTTNEYADNVGSWLLCRLTRTQVTETHPSGTATRTSAFEYNPSTGLLTSETVEPGGPLTLKTTYGYDSFGNKNSISVGSNPIAGDPNPPRTTTITYDTRGQFVQTISKGTINYRLHSETHVYDRRHGGRTQLTDANGRVTSWQHDAFGRVTLETRPDTSATLTTYTACTPTCPVGARGKMYIQTVNSDGSAAATILDSREREIASYTLSFDNTLITRLTYYDYAGRKYSDSAPHFEGATACFSYYYYDEMGRPDAILAPTLDLECGAMPTSLTDFAYSGLSSTVTDARNNPTTRTMDALGRTTQVTDANSGNSYYSYDPFGNLTQVTDAMSNVTAMGYDLRGRKLNQTDPDMGAWTYEYNRFGELTKQTDAKSQMTLMAYDVLGRMSARVDNEGLTAWFYDERWIGAMHRVYSPGHSEDYLFDGLGRVTTLTSGIDSYSYITNYAYDSESRISQITYPSTGDPNNRIWLSPRKPRVTRKS